MGAIEESELATLGARSLDEFSKQSSAGRGSCPCCGMRDVNTFLELGKRRLAGPSGNDAHTENCTLWCHSSL